MTFAAITEPVAVCDAIAGALEDGGVRCVLGLPGGYLSPLYAALVRRPLLRVVTVRQESVATVMAEALGRMTGRPAAVLGQGAWLAGNAGQGLLEAHLGSSPLIVLTDMTEGGEFSHHAPYQGGSGEYGSWDTTRALQAMTKQVMVSHQPGQAVQHVQLAIKHATLGDPGPVAVVFRGSSLAGEVGPDTRPRIYPTTAYTGYRDHSIDHSAVSAAARALSEAQRPVIIAGNGVRVGRAQSQLRQLAEALDAPVATTASGKGVFPETGSRALGVIGTFGAMPANAVVGSSDLILAVGTRLAPMDTVNESPALIDPQRQVLVQVDVEALNASWTFPADHVLVGDAAVLLPHLKAALTVSGPRSSCAADRVAAARAQYPPQRPAAGPTTRQAIHPQRLIDTIGDVMPADVVVTCDAGENRLFMLHWYRTPERGDVLQPAAAGGMGYAVPAALAAKLADPHRPVLAVCGDGGFGMSLAALMTAVQEQLVIGVVVFNNQTLGWVRHELRDQDGRTALGPFDHASLARSIGCTGIRAESVEGLRAALRALEEASAPVVIDVPTSLETSFRDIAARMPR